MKKDIWGFEKKEKKKKKDTTLEDVAKTSLYIAGTAIAIGVSAKILQDL